MAQTIPGAKIAVNLCFGFGVFLLLLQSCDFYTLLVICYTSVTTYSISHLQTCKPYIAKSLKEAT